MQEDIGNFQFLYYINQIELPIKLHSKIKQQQLALSHKQEINPLDL